jgi:hypothetical protein
MIAALGKGSRATTAQEWWVSTLTVQISPGQTPLVKLDAGISVWQFLPHFVSFSCWIYLGIPLVFKILMVRIASCTFMDRIDY